MNLRDERGILEGLCRLLLSDRDLEKACRAYTKFSNSKAPVEVARQHKVVTILYRNLALLRDKNIIGESDPLFRACELEYDQALQHRKLLHNELIRLLPKLSINASPARVLLLKGLSIQNYYPCGYLRWMRDIDLMFGTAEDAFVAYSLMSRDGYSVDRFELPWFKKDACQGLPLYGQIVLKKDFDEDYSRFDIHYGLYSVSYNAWLDCNFWSSAKRMTIDGVPFDVLDAEACLLLMFAHMLSQGYVSIKDINDFVAVISAQEVNWDHVLSSAERSQLLPQVYKVADHSRRLYDHTSVTMPCSEILRKGDGSRFRIIWQPHNRNWGLRAAVNSLFTFFFERYHNSRTIISSLTSALQCFLYYIRRLRFEYRPRGLRERVLARVTPSHDLSKGLLSSKTCVRLVPLKVDHGFDSSNAIDIRERKTIIEDKLGFELRAFGSRVLHVKQGQVELIMLGNHAFIPTFDMVVPPVQKRASERMATHVISWMRDAAMIGEEP